MLDEGQRANEPASRANDRIGEREQAYLTSRGDRGSGGCRANERERKRVKEREWEGVGEGVRERGRLVCRDADGGTDRVEGLGGIRSLVGSRGTTGDEPSLRCSTETWPSLAGERRGRQPRAIRVRKRARRSRERDVDRDTWLPVGATDKKKERDSVRMKRSRVAETRLAYTELGGTAR